ncbi:MAG: hypothetical protein A3D44_02895 [Candidatus Staskawiczbacteria bacterium RIFCSPHIGHO2_02_FULL_42_22]|uniref:Uncharacterized protein n=1 Tax=Candidatus Staskawiczbacteria bacterium RIFCSPHIGHO2_02_FULL_42_22 TaxID=1802207 RepID=A0A1G2I3J5_9BACT|nr:MAG: hypothetical protein A3D44_02895 [Candidatus Staskawiczbacteria bacterium RIFCSPHIGHO2_02_FULL_42_22]
MPYIDDNNKPSFLDKNKGSSYVPKREPLGPKGFSQKESFKGGGIISDIKRKVGSVDFRKKIGVELGNKPWDSKAVSDVVKDIESKLDRFGTVIDKNEIRSLGSEAAKLNAYWDSIHAREEEFRDRIITPEEKLNRSIHKVGKDLFEGLFNSNEDDK